MQHRLVDVLHNRYTLTNVEQFKSMLNDSLNINKFKDKL